MKLPASQGFHTQLPYIFRQRSQGPSVLRSHLRIMKIRTVWQILQLGWVHTPLLPREQGRQTGPIFFAFALRSFSSGEGLGRFRG